MIHLADNTKAFCWGLLCILSIGGCSSIPPAVQVTGGAAGSAVVTQDSRPTVHGDSALTRLNGPIAQNLECNQTDSTVSCCLKKHPGEYERCGAMAPRQRPPQKPNRLPPLTDLTPEEARAREEMCREHWDRCIERGGEYERRGQYGQTICRACWQTCKANGVWPDQVNDIPCLGGSP